MFQQFLSFRDQFAPSISNAKFKTSNSLEAPVWPDASADVLRSDSFLHRLALNQLVTVRWTLDEDLEAYREKSIPAIGVSWRKLCESGVQQGIRKIQRSGLAVSNLSWVGGFTGQHGYGLRETILEARRAIRVAAQLRAESVTVITGAQNRHIDSHACRLVTQSMRELAELAAIYNVKLALQPMHAIYAQNWTFLQSLDDALEMLDRIDHPSVGLALGTYHLGEEDKVIERVRDIIDRIVIVQLADRRCSPKNENDQCLPGEGVLPIRALVASLEAHGYDGWYQTEVWSQDLWKLDHHDLIDRCRTAHLRCMP
ncbi:Xylose isomerase-like TIM barrel [Thalassoglobus neptunius]|uniref:Xylose isomerase-like TIM barrel n=1 Tax=Thalassoglobus neptunius TaxID=1938619 RepID=A0A5C5WPP0_9PLAN|nr:Xylose isomerase-like TIM barrel [Thalassoglobus neptunius]